MGLTAEQRRGFHTDGYLVVEGLIPPAQIERLRAEMQGYHERLQRQAPADVLVSWEPGSEGAANRRIQQILNAEKLSPLLDALIRSPAIVEPVRSLIGPDVCLFESKFLMKSAAVGGPIPWHQDYAYWQGVTGWPVHVNCMIYIDDADVDNGCLQVLPGTHCLGLRAHRHGSRGSIFDRELEDAASGHPRPVLLPGRAGTAIFFGPLLMHASGPNASSRERRSATVVYTIPETQRRGRVTIAARPPAGDVGDFFPASRIKVFVGEGPHGGQCAINYRRRELWKLAAEHVRGPGGTWVDASVSLAEDDALAWWVAHKPEGVLLFRLETCPSPAAPNRDDVHVIGGPIPEAVERIEPRLGERLGLLAIDGRYYFPTRQTLSSLRPWIAEGTIIVVDRFYGDAGWQGQAALAVREAATEWRLGIEYLARSDYAVALRVSGVGKAASVDCPPVDWSPSVHGIRFEYGDIADPERSTSPAARPARPLLHAARRVLGRTVRALGLRRPMAWTQSIAGVRPASANGGKGGGDLDVFFPVIAIPRFDGDGPHGAYCPTHSRRRELWKYAIALVEDGSLPWCEFGVGEGESLDWFALRKPRANLLFGFDSFEGIPEPWLRYPVGHWRAPAYRPNRSDVVIVPGRFEQTLSDEAVRGRLGPQIGLLHVDCDVYSSTKVVLEGLRGLIGPGTVIVFDEFYGYDGWADHEARAFREFLLTHGVAFEYVARSDFQIAVRILAVGVRAAWSIRPLDWASTVPGIAVGVPAVGAAASARPA